MIDHYTTLKVYPHNDYLTKLGLSGTFFTFVGKPAEADLLIHPATREHQKHIDTTHHLLTLGGTLNKPLVAFALEDRGIPIDGFFNLIYAGNKGWKFNGVSIPGWPQSLKTMSRINLPTVKRERPKVNFCGTAQTDPLRRKALDALKASGLDHEIIERPKYFYWLFDERGSPTERDGLIDFARTMEECDYNLCVRGYANTSMRLYETLCAGRIPLVLDTGALLPRSDAPEWGLCCTVSSLDNLQEKVLKHWQTVDLGYFAKCRQFWADKLSPLEWFRWLHAILEQKCRIPHKT